MRKFLYCVFLSCFCFLLSFGNTMAAGSNATPIINNVRISISQDKVRVVADASGEVDYRSFVLQEPQRVVIDLTDATIGKDVKREYTVDSPYVKKIRLGQFDNKTVRIVVETNIKDNGYDVFGLTSKADDYRVVMDFGNVTYSHQNKQTLKKAVALNTTDKNKTVAKPKVQPVAKTAEKPRVLTSVGMSRKRIEEARAFNPKSSAPTDIPYVNYTITSRDKAALEGKKITIDPGHGGSDSGAIGPTGIMEKNVTFKVAMDVAKLLKDSGATVYLTRKGDNDVAPQPATDVEELQARADVANNTNSDVFVSIHIDAFTTPQAAGTSAWYYVKGSQASKDLAAALNKRVVENLGTYNRGTRGSNFYVVKHTNMPATLVELGFLSNPKEEAYLSSDDGVRRAALGIYQGLVDYFSA